MWVDLYSFSSSSSPSLTSTYFATSDFSSSLSSSSFSSFFSFSPFSFFFTFYFSSFYLLLRSFYSFPSFFLFISLLIPPFSFFSLLFPWKNPPFSISYSSLFLLTLFSLLFRLSSFAFHFPLFPESTNNNNYALCAQIEFYTNKKYWHSQETTSI